MYDIKIISFDLRHEETVFQAIHALEYLQETIDNAFDKIDKRIFDNNERVQCIQSRINIATNKVKKIFMSNKAIKLFAPSKFPAANVLVDISSTFDVFPHSFTEKIMNYDVEDSQPLSNNAFQNKLVFFHVRNEYKRNVLPKILFKNHEVCWIPNYLKFVNTVLLFNIFEKGPDIRNSKGKYFVRDNVVNKQDHGVEIVPAPASITNRQISDKFNIDLLYIPKLSGAPHINLPLDLPDLPGIADDVQFESSEVSKITPSLCIEKNIPPTLFHPIPKAPSPPIVIASNIQVELPKMIKADCAILHPPPPVAPTPPKMMTVVNTSSTVTQSTDSRSNLMDAIRKAGGTMGGKLRTSIDVHKKIAEKDEKYSANNLLDDLHNKLLMRRKGISGTNLKSENVIQRLSELMPPPPAHQNDSSPDITDDDDWK